MTDYIELDKEAAFIDIDQLIRWLEIQKGKGAKTIFIDGFDNEDIEFTINAMEE